MTMAAESKPNEWRLCGQCKRDINRRFNNKQGTICKTKLMNLKQTIRTKIPDTCIEAERNLRSTD
jgi:hypothetical protein